MALASPGRDVVDSWARAKRATIARTRTVRSASRIGRRAVTGPLQSRSCQITTMTHATRDDEPRDSSAHVALRDITPESELRATIRLALPVVLVQIGMMFMGVVDTVMVGHVSSSVLAAVALGNLYFFNAIVLANGTLMALDPIIGANLCNAGLNWVFVYGNLGSPALGAAGSALATLVSRWLMAIAVLALAWSTLRPHLAPVRREAWRFAPIARVLQLGIPVGLQ